MSRYQIRNVTLYKWFPKDDKIAAHMARLCILREDFSLELASSAEDSIPTIDENGVDWRKIYFFRALCKTLLGISGVVASLQKMKEFQNFLKDQPNIKKLFDQLKEKLEQGHTIIKDIRNEVSGHILEKPMHEALDNMDLERFGTLQIGSNFANIHYKFVSELIMAMLFRKIPSHEQGKYAKEILDKFFGVVNAVMDAIDSVIIVYAKSRRLL